MVTLEEIEKDTPMMQDKVHQKPVPDAKPFFGAIPSTRYIPHLGVYPTIGAIPAVRTIPAVGAIPTYRYAGYPYAYAYSPYLRTYPALYHGLTATVQRTLPYLY